MHIILLQNWMLAASMLINVWTSSQQRFSRIKSEDYTVFDLNLV